MEGLEKALKTIKEECERHNDNCEDCPFKFQYDDCAVTKDTPNQWKIKERKIIEL